MQQMHETWRWHKMFNLFKIIIQIIQNNFKRLKRNSYGFERIQFSSKEFKYNKCMTLGDVIFNV